MQYRIDAHIFDESIITVNWASSLEDAYHIKKNYDEKFTDIRVSITQINKLDSGAPVDAVVICPDDERNF